MLTLYGNLRSRTMRPVWLLRELGVEYRLEPVIQAYRLADPDAPGAPFNTASPGFLAINPMGQVPAMVDADFALSESVAITLYLARKFGGPLAPADAREEALALQWALLGTSEVERSALEILIAHHLVGPDTPGGQSKRAAAREALARPFARIDAHLEGRDWLIGGRFTVADILLAEMVRFAEDEGDWMAGYANLHRWLVAARSRPAYAALWAERNAEPA